VKSDRFFHGDRSLTHLANGVKYRLKSGVMAPFHGVNRATFTGTARGLCSTLAKHRDSLLGKCVRRKTSPTMLFWDITPQFKIHQALYNFTVILRLGFG
jgi:hypothetical protein